MYFFFLATICKATEYKVAYRARSLLEVFFGDFRVKRGKTWRKLRLKPLRLAGGGGGLRTFLYRVTSTIETRHTPSASTIAVTTCFL